MYLLPSTGKYRQKHQLQLGSKTFQFDVALASTVCCLPQPILHFIDSVNCLMVESVHFMSNMKVQVVLEQSLQLQPGHILESVELKLLLNYEFMS